MRPLTTPLVDLGGPPPDSPAVALVCCARSRISLVRQLARHVKARFTDLGGSLTRVVADGRRFTEFVDDHFGVRKLSNLKPKHVQAWLEDLFSRGGSVPEIEAAGASLATLGLLRPKRVERIVSTIRSR